MQFDLQHMLMYAVAFALAITVHEFAHAWGAYSSGDDTPKRQGRLSLNPLDHLDPIGTLMFVLILVAQPRFAFAWGKPVQTNPANYRDPRRDGIKVAFFGPLSNIVTAFILAMVLRFVTFDVNDPLLVLIDLCIRFNLGIAFFNLIPISPLDGSHILANLLPIESARRYAIFMGRYGLFILLALIFTRASMYLVGIPATLVYILFMGLG